MFVDTNALVRARFKTSPSHDAARATLARAGANSEPIRISRQVVCVSLVFAVTRHVLAASASVLAPAGALVYSLSFDVHPDLGSWDRVLLIVFSLVWLRYSMRLMYIAKRYREMPPPPAQD